MLRSHQIGSDLATPQLQLTPGQAGTSPAHASNMQSSGGLRACLGLEGMRLATELDMQVELTCTLEPVPAI